VIATERHIPDVHTYDALLGRARERAQLRKPRAALVDPFLPDAIRAFSRAVSEGLVDPVVIGDKGKVAAAFENASVDLPPGVWSSAADTVQGIETACRMANEGEIDLIVQGRVRVSDFLSILFEHDLCFRVNKKTVSHVAVIKPEKYPKLLMLTDGGVVVQPDFQTKIELIANLVSVSEHIGIPMPRIAVLAAVEVIYAQMVATMDGAVLAKMSERGQIKGAYVDGPLSFDVAVDMSAARSKGITNSSVAGQADAMLAPNIEVANGVYNAMTLYGRADVGGVVVGGRIPLAVNSRGDSEQARFHSIVLAALVC
jgi:phosphate butyryltransferase